MSEIQITIAEVAQTANKLRQHNQRLNEILMAIKKIMNDLEANWQSPAAQTIRQKLNGMQPLFSQYYETIEAYAKFLDQTAIVYEQAESIMNQQASSFH